MHCLATTHHSWLMDSSTILGVERLTQCGGPSSAMVEDPSASGHHDIVPRIFQSLFYKIQKPFPLSVTSSIRLFEETDRDGDKFISFPELKEFLQEIISRKLQLDKDSGITDVMKVIDIDNDKKITKDEFVNGMTKLLDEMKDAMNKRYQFM
ncbi:Uncharacterized protein Adt_45119 [Abeliophyllum distichum]|uniref:EF-hand domain-containing protein n=1 Tax=Abeliophyllum distichum TaxID=126358 RepID=A0ABD1PDK4_9LAMI